MRSLAFEDYIFIPGMRVAARVKDNWYYGCITDVSDDNMIDVLFDFKENRKRVHASYVVPVSLWTYNPKAVQLSEIPVTKLLPQKSVNKIAATVNLQICYSMWLYINEVVWNGELKPPAFRITASSKLLGVCYPTALKGEKTLIEFSKKNVSSKSLFDTIAHEMVHQWQFEIEAKDRSKLPLINTNAGHGPDFMEWAPVLEEKIGVKLNRFADMVALTDVDVMQDTKNRQEPFYYGILEFPAQDSASEFPVYLAIRFKDQEQAETFYAEMLSRRKKIFGAFLAWVASNTSSFFGKRGLNIITTPGLCTLTIRESTNGMLYKILKVASMSNFMTNWLPMPEEQVNKLSDDILASFNALKIFKHWE